MDEGKRWNIVWQQKGWCEEFVLHEERNIFCSYFLVPSSYPEYCSSCYDLLIEYHIAIASYPTTKRNLIIPPWKPVSQETTLNKMAQICSPVRMLCWLAFSDLPEASIGARMVCLRKPLIIQQFYSISSMSSMCQIQQATALWAHGHGETPQQTTYPILLFHFPWLRSYIWWLS
jgi:hypothetical protein